MMVTREWCKCLLLHQRGVLITLTPVEEQRAALLQPLVTDGAVAELLREMPNIDGSYNDDSCPTPLHHAPSNGHDRVADSLTTKPNIRQNSNKPDAKLDFRGAACGTERRGEGTEP